MALLYLQSAALCGGFASPCPDGMAVESMHWLLDDHFEEDYLRVANKTIRENMNLLRKFALGMIKQYKSRTASKRPLSKLMFDCLLDSK